VMSSRSGSAFRIIQQGIDAGIVHFVVPAPPPSSSDLTASGCLLVRIGGDRMIALHKHGSSLGGTVLTKHGLELDGVLYR
jgi:hypothetical protein